MVRTQWTYANMQPGGLPVESTSQSTSDANEIQHKQDNEPTSMTGKHHVNKYFNDISY